MTAENSRNWIVSNNKEQLEKYVPLSHGLKDDLEPYFQDFRFLKQGYK